MIPENLIYLDKTGNLIYKQTNIRLTSDQLFDLRTQIGRTTLEILELQYRSIIELRRQQNLEILLH